MVTGLRALAGAAPMGECELGLTWTTGQDTRACDCSDGARLCVARLDREGAQSVFRRARDIVAGSGAWMGQCGCARRILAGLGRTMRTRNGRPWLVRMGALL
jgi:hypothetical protein